MIELRLGYLMREAIRAHQSRSKELLIEEMIELRIGYRPSQPPPEEVVVLLRVGLIPHKEDVAKMDLELAVDEHLPN